MQVEIQANGFEVSNSLHRHIEQRLLSSFKFTKQRIRKVIVRFNRVTVSNKQLKESCRIQTVVNGLPHIITEHHDNNLYAAADTAIKRANRSVRKRISKLRELRRKKFQQAKNEITHTQEI